MPACFLRRIRLHVPSRRRSPDGHSYTSARWCYEHRGSTYCNTSRPPRPYSCTPRARICLFRSLFAPFSIDARSRRHGRVLHSSEDYAQHQSLLRVCPTTPYGHRQAHTPALLVSPLKPRQGTQPVAKADTLILRFVSVMLLIGGPVLNGRTTGERTPALDAR